MSHLFNGSLNRLASANRKEKSVIPPTCHVPMGHPYVRATMVSGPPLFKYNETARRSSAVSENGRMSVSVPLTVSLVWLLLTLGVSSLCATPISSVSIVEFGISVVGGELASALPS